MNTMNNDSTDSKYLTINLPDLTGADLVSQGVGSFNTTVSNSGTGQHTYDNFTWISTQKDISGKIQAKDVELTGTLKIKDVDIGDVLKKIEERLAILHPNVELEEKWERLKTLGKMYRELEKEILEKEKIYEILKNSS